VGLSPLLAANSIRPVTNGLIIAFLISVRYILCFRATSEGGRRLGARSTRELYKRAHVASGGLVLSGRLFFYPSVPDLIHNRYITQVATISVTQVRSPPPPPSKGGDILKPPLFTGGWGYLISLPHSFTICSNSKPLSAKTLNIFVPLAAVSRYLGVPMPSAFICVHLRLKETIQKNKNGNFAKTATI